MSDLKRIVALATLMKEQTAEVERLDDELKAAKEALRSTEREDLPTLMTELGLSSIKLESGETVSIREECDASITEKTRERALAWLLVNGFGGIIKTSVVAQFERGARDAALETYELLAGKTDAAVGIKEDVHHSTLKAFVKEQLAAGAPIPLDVFNVYPYNKAVISKGK